MKIVAATNNAHKIKEINGVLGDNYSLTSLSEVGILEDIPEEEDSLEGNAFAKANYVYSKTGMDVFADDTGLEVFRLGNKPGVYSARYAGEQKSADDNIDLLLKQLKDSSNREARFRTVISLIISGKEYVFEGIIKGKIAHKRKGSEGFGYDPIFIPDGYNESFAQMSMEMKNEISHRAIAVRKLVSFLESLAGQ